MSIQYSGAVTYTTFTTTTGTRREVVDGLVGVLTTAGWTVVSGSGTGDVKMSPADSGQGLTEPIFRITDPGSGNCARVRLYNSTESVGQTSGGCYLLPAAAKVFTVHANAYQFFVWVGTSTTAREFMCGGMPWVPSHLAGSTITEIAFLQCNSNSDSDTSTRPSFRTVPTTVGNGANYPNMAALTNSTLWENNAGNFGVNWAPGVIQLTGVGPFQWSNNNGTTLNAQKWADSSYLIYEPLIGWSSSTPGSSEGVLVGQLWDCVGMSQSFSAGATTSFDSHNWVNVCASNTGTSQQFNRNSLWLVT